MVQPTTSEAERRAWSIVFRVGFVLLIAGSAALIAVQGGASPVEIGAVALFGAAFGAVLLRYVVWLGR